MITVTTLRVNDKKAVQVANVVGTVGAGSFAYDEKLTVSPFLAYQLALELLYALREEHGFKLNDPSSPLASLLKAGA